jgi:DUF917 family protein
MCISSNDEIPRKQTTMPRELKKEDIDDIRIGAGFLASGGGGAVWGPASDHLINQLETLKHPVTVVKPDELKDDDVGAVVAVMGSPDAVAKKGINSKAVKKVWQLLEETWFDKKDQRFNYALPVEIGSLSSLIPMLISGETGIPVVDGDGAGRAVPALQVLTYAACFNGEGLPPSPLVLGNDDVDRSAMRLVVKHAPSAAAVDDILRGVLGGQAFADLGPLSLWAQDASKSKNRDIVAPNGLTASQSLGNKLKNAKSGSPKEIYDNCLNALRSSPVGRKPIPFPLFIGTLAKPEEKTAGAFDIVTVTLTAKDGSKARILGQNENLIAWSSAQRHPLAISPDSMCYLALDGLRKGMPLSNADLNDVVGSTLALIGIQAIPQMRTKAIVDRFLDLMRPFGYGGDYVHIEDLNSS